MTLGLRFSNERAAGVCHCRVDAAPPALPFAPARHCRLMSASRSSSVRARSAAKGTSPATLSPLTCSFWFFHACVSGSAGGIHANKLDRRIFLSLSRIKARSKSGSLVCQDLRARYRFVSGISYSVISHYDACDSPGDVASGCKVPQT